MIDPFSIVGLVIIAILVLFFGRIMSVIVKVVFYGLLVVLVLILFFGVSLDTVLDFGIAMVMWAF